MLSNPNISQISSVLFVCMGNICRSPTAEAVFKHKISRNNLSITVDSAGTTGAHAKEKPDHRAVKAGMARGYDFTGLKARKVTKDDFKKFDLVLAMDNDNLRNLMALADESDKDKIKLFLTFAPECGETEVPDPYYGGAGGFNYVLDLVEQASDGLIDLIKQGE